ncbi:MAG: hypothetical protein Q7U70_05790 [Methylotenera sp.]|nr:hypothetical protein [Methylotenera sp.]MDO9479788.1 hypothetical protein [Hydrogenophaga sp.]
MSSYLARLKLIDAEKTLILPSLELPKLPEVPELNIQPPFGSFGSASPGNNKPINTDDDLVSNWWLVTFKGFQPIEVAIYPPCTKAEAMALNPNATFIKPMTAPILKVIPINTAPELFHAMRGCGYSLHLNMDNGLVVDPKNWADDELLDLITKHKFELIKILKLQASNGYL